MSVDQDALVPEALPMEPVRPVPIAERALLPVVALLQLMLGYWVSQALYVAARLGVADVLTSGPKPIGAIAEATGASPDAVTAISIPEGSARTIAFGCDNGLQKLAPARLRVAIWHGEPWHWGPWGDLLETVRSGAPAFDRVYGQDQFAYFAAHPDAAAVFDQAMTGFSTASNLLAVSMHYFGGIDTLVDVGVGRGKVLIGLLGMHAHLRGVLFDRPPVVDAARADVEIGGVADRCEFVGGDFFEAVPGGHDAYLLSMVLNDWDDGHATGILRAVRDAMRPDSVLLLAQMVVPPAAEPSFAKLMDLEMLVHTGGRERTEEDFRGLLADAGLELVRFTPTISPVGLLVGRPAEGGSTRV